MSQAHGTVPHQQSACAESQPRSLLVKVDRPRRIDPYINYFGEGARPIPTTRLAMERAG